MLSMSLRSACASSAPREASDCALGLLGSRVMARILYLDASVALLSTTDSVLPPWLPVAPKIVKIFFDMFI